MGLRLVQRLGWGGQGLQLCGVKHLHCCLFLSNLVTNNTATIKPVQFMVILVMLQIRLINSQMCCHKYISNHLRGISVLLQIRPVSSQVCCHKYTKSPHGYQFCSKSDKPTCRCVAYRYIKSAHGYWRFVTIQTSQLAGVLPHLNPIDSWVCRLVTDQTKWPIDVLGLLHLRLINSPVYCYI